MEHNEWIDRLKPGDKVGVRVSIGMGRSVVIVPVVKITATQIVVSVGDTGKTDRFNRKTLARVGGGSFPRTHIVEATPRVMDEAMRQHYITRLFRIYERRESLSLQQLRAIVEAYDATEEKTDD